MSLGSFVAGFICGIVVFVLMGSILINEEGKRGEDYDNKRKDRQDE